MNMISTVPFYGEMDGANKQAALVKKLTAVWERKNSKVARAGGASLMALSLAACGGSSDNEYSAEDLADAKTEALTSTSGTEYSTVDAAYEAGEASVDITSDNTDVMLSDAE